MQDEEGDWVAELDCGHTQHVRHNPPWELRPWVVSQQGRAAHIGIELACKLCEMPRLPDGVVEYKRTKSFDADTVPAGLLKSHNTKAGVWGEIVVERGHVTYVVETTPPKSFPLNERVRGVVEPEQNHHVEVMPGASFHVRFLRYDRSQ
jgi:tellurite resistance-related uncharacterized protein